MGIMTTTTITMMRIELNLLSLQRNPTQTDNHTTQHLLRQTHTHTPFCIRALAGYIARLKSVFPEGFVVSKTRVSPNVRKVAPKTVSKDTVSASSHRL